MGTPQVLEMFTVELRGFGLALIGAMDRLANLWPTLPLP